MVFVFLEFAARFQGWLRPQPCAGGVARPRFARPSTCTLRPKRSRRKRRRRAMERKGPNMGSGKLQSFPAPAGRHDPDIDAATAMMLLNTPPEIQAGFPPGVIQNGARVLSRGIFPGARPLPINPIGSMAVAVRTGWKSFKMNGITNCRMRTESEQSCGSPVVSGDPKEDHNYSSAKSSNHRSTSPASDSVSSSSADDQYEFATKGSQDSSEGSEVSFQSHESHSETEEEDKKQNRKETKDSLADSGYASQHKKRQHLMKAKKVPSDTLPLKKRRTEKPPESDDEEMKEAAGSLLHLAGIRSCLNNITNRTAKGQKEQKETTKN
uniref:Forkhead box N3 n=1 Tax=Anas platyrhynchos platyrhynchos TaxID=8840 RepID=A0A493U267_ANAPP